MSASIRFYFDYISPNAYLAWTQLPKLAEKYGCAIEPAAVLYAALLDAHGQLGPGEMPAKGRWMGRNLLRKAALLGLRMSLPPFFPFNPILPLRVSILPMESKQKVRIIDAFFQAVWVRELHISEPGVVERLCNEVRLDGAGLIADAQSAEIKARLRALTDEAIGRGVFGVPSMEVGEELFWGYDDFQYLELFLAGKDPLDAKALEKWSAPKKASSVRRRVRRDGE